MMLVEQRLPGKVEASDRRDGAAQIVIGISQQEGDDIEHADLRGRAAYPLSITRTPWRMATAPDVGLGRYCQVQP
jgi:hypothetical protein